MVLPPATRTTESSTGRTIGRSCTKNTSAAFSSFCNASSTEMHKGSPLKLPLVTTRGFLHISISSACTGEDGSIIPAKRLNMHTEGAKSTFFLLTASTMGASGDASSRFSSSVKWHRASAAAISGTITANGLASLPFSFLSRLTAPSDAASASNWKPPTPMRATIRPSASTHAT